MDKIEEKTNIELIRLVEKQVAENGGLREEIGRLKALLDVANHQKRSIPTEEA